MISQGQFEEVRLGQLSATGLARVVLDGEILVNTTRGTLAAALPTAIGDACYGVVHDTGGADPAFDEQPVRILRRGEKRVRFEDNATVAVGALLMPSAADAGAWVTAAGTGARPQAIALQAISSGTTEQYIRAEIFCDGSELLPTLP